MKGGCTEKSADGGIWQSRPPRISWQDWIAPGGRINSSRVGITIGIDLGDIWSHYCTLNEDAEVVDRGRLRTNPFGVDKRFRQLERVRVAKETGTHSIWVSEQIQELGNEVNRGQRARAAGDLTQRPEKRPGGRREDRPLCAT